MAHSVIDGRSGVTREMMSLWIAVMSLSTEISQLYGFAENLALDCDRSTSLCIDIICQMYNIVYYSFFFEL